MSWFEKLYDTYESNFGILSEAEKTKLWPVSHTSAQAHIEIVLNKDGKFKGARVIPKEEGMTLMPATEDSAGRTSGGAPHPLCDKIQYVAGDYASYGGEKSAYFEDFRSKNEVKDGYYNTLRKWMEYSEHPRLKAIFAYIQKQNVVNDLIQDEKLHIGQDGKLMVGWSGKSEEKPEIFKVLTGKDQGDALVRWRVELDISDKATGTWEDQKLIDSWIQYYETMQSGQALCCLTGQEAVLATKHPSKIRHAADMAKLISSNDMNGFTFRGNFTEAGQAASMGYGYMQKSYNALRWLIGKQAYRNEDQVIVTWEVSGKEIPSPFKNSHELAMQIAENRDDEDDEEDDFSLTERLDNTEQKEARTGEHFALTLNNAMKGKHTEAFKQAFEKRYEQIDEADQIVVMGLDSASPGRLSITYYRELFGSEFLERIVHWHTHFVWYQNYAKDVKFVGAPSPADIAQAAYGRRLDDKLKKATVQRILPCIIDQVSFPNDLVNAAFHRVCNRVGLDAWEWEKVLGIVCALYKGTNEREDYQMALDEKRTTRDYLYGRLLATAERMESAALHVADERRDTNAGRLMNRFADRPYSTWVLIEKALIPYKSRLLNRRPATHKYLCDLLDEINFLFDADDYMKDTKLSAEFLLGYHCQRRAFFDKMKSDRAKKMLAGQEVLDDNEDEITE
jgi:CRISPR-associated protein Csd1